MNADAGSEALVLLAAARAGRSECLGDLLQLYRNYLLLLARTQIDLHLQGRVDASDAVQETFLDACSDFANFRGTTEAEFWPGCARSWSSTWRAWCRSKCSPRSAMPGAMCLWISNSPLWNNHPPGCKMPW
jgi:DNA-directed RNA polymerase specialized sigma24 family protein